MTNKTIYMDIEDQLEDKINSGEYEWDSICAAIPIEGHHGFGLVVWCENSEGCNAYDVSIRKDFLLNDWDGSEAIVSESTDTDEFEQLENVINSVLNKFYSKELCMS